MSHGVWIAALPVFAALLLSAGAPGAAERRSPAPLPELSPWSRVLSGADEITWSQIKDSDDVDVLRAFILQFPDSPLRWEAEGRIIRLTGQATGAEPTR